MVGPRDGEAGDSGVFCPRWEAGPRDSPRHSSSRDAVVLNGYGTSVGSLRVGKLPEARPTRMVLEVLHAVGRLCCILEIYAAHHQKEKSAASTGIDCTLHDSNRIGTQTYMHAYIHTYERLYITPEHRTSHTYAGALICI